MNKRKPSQSIAAKTALGAMATALSVVLLIPTALDLLYIALPAAAGIIVLFCVIELSKGWAFGVYAATSIISILVVPNKEAVVLYTLFFGYYPILKGLIEGKIKNRFLEYVVKVLIFNVAVFSAEFVFFKIMNIPLTEFLDVEEGSVLSKYIIPILFVTANVMFFFLDFLYTASATLYISKWQKIFRKTFRFK